MKNNITLTIQHPNAVRMQFFLNQVKEALKEIPFDWESLQLADRVTGGCKFVSTNDKNKITISVLFCDSYHDANEIAKANALPLQPKARWSVNGDLLYWVECEDEEKVSDILSLFAGEE